MPRIILLTLMAALLAVGLYAPRAAAESEKPNVVIFLTDDQGWGDLSSTGNTNLNTPHIDSLARDGARLENFYVCPVCSPTRAEMLTGRYHPRGGVFSTSTGGERLDLDERTVAEAFQQAGYATGAFGKWHNGMQYPYHPQARGFDEYYGFCSGHWGHYFSPQLEHNGRLVQGGGYVIDDFTGRAMKFIEKHRERPFFVYLPYCTPHSPMQVPDRFYKDFEGKQLHKRHREPKREDAPKTRAALAMCENIDWNVGRVLQQLDKLKLAENTIVIFFTDNGPNSWRYNGGMRGRKGSTDEGGVRVPCYVRWPKSIAKGKKIPQICGAIDLLPTLTSLAGIDRVGDKPLDGVDLSPLLTAKTDAQGVRWPDRMIFSHWRDRVSVRTQQYRLDDKGRLYDVVKDRGQTKEISRQQPEVTAKLKQAVKRWRGEVLSELSGSRDRPFTVGYKKFPVTHLPARDGSPHGGVQRSARAPNCSFFQNWKQPGDRITWDVQVHTPGKYEAVLHYTCPPGEVGSTIELSLGDAAVTAKITEAHDPPLRGKAQDRVPRRGESYVKDFKPLKLGTLELKQGRRELTLRATDIPGNYVADVRYVVLTLLEE